MTDVPFPPMTRYEQLVFDLKGFLVIPSVLSETEIQTVRDHMDNYRRDPNSLPKPHPPPISGPAEFLIDHPRIMDILQTLIDPDHERIRLESVFTSARSIDDSAPWLPHVGGTNVLPSFSYRHHNGRIYSAMTRVDWELNEVVKGKGGTRLEPGSHKANTASAHAGDWPQAADAPVSGVWETSDCPPGSPVVFSEALCHTGAAWTHPDDSRSAILITYNHVTVRHNEPKPCMNSTVIGGLSESRQGCFRDVWVLGNKR